MAHLGELFERAGTALLDFAERAESNALQGRFFEAMSHLRQHRETMLDIFRAEIEQGFEQLGDVSPASTELPEDSAELSLIAPEDMEESVATENIIIKTNATCFPELYALSQRFAVLNGGRKLKDFEIPGGPHHLVHAFRRSLKAIDVEFKVKVILYALFDKIVARAAGTLYRDMNNLLKTGGILPQIRPISVRKGRESRRASDDAQAPVGAPGARTHAHGEGGARGGELFDTILELMSTHHGRREHDAKASRPIAKEQVLAAFDKVPRPTPVPPPPKVAPGAAGGAVAGPTQVEVDKQFVGQLKQAIGEQREQVLDALDREQLAPVDADLIDLIGMLFEYMLNDPVLPNSAKALISHLHTPYLKVALIDRRLLVSSDHPARRLLDEMVEAGSLWVEEGNPTRGIFPYIQRVVDRVLQEFSDDVRLFDELLEYFQRGVEEQRRRADTMEQRTQEAVRGRERLQLAKQRAAREVRALVARHPLPEPVLAFLHRNWLDVLAFVLLRNEGNGASAAWRAAVADARQLVNLFDPTLDDAALAPLLTDANPLCQRLQDGVRALGSYNRTGLDGLAAVLGEPRAWRERLLAGVPQPVVTSGEVSCALAAEQSGVGLRTGSEESGDEHLSAEERAMVERLRKTRFGTWFEFAGAEGNPPRRIKLSWMSLMTSTCMFVDRAGMQAEIKTLRDLAREMLAGQARVVQKPEHPFIQRALVSIRKVLSQDDAVSRPGG